MGNSNIEILAPAGGKEQLIAAVEAGADAVYFGVKKLNARMGAQNFLLDSLPETMAFLHKNNVRGYLTLNIDLHQREINLAAEIIEAAAQAKVDALLIRDPALLELMRFFPELEFHFSTQAAVSSSAGMLAARELGLTRVVLARELSQAEISAASAISGIETEVFVQGALCFSCSGRCLLSSWGGGRSGNRGSCTSPCRVLWTTDKEHSARPMSMYDLCLLENLNELQQSGIKSMKIEGRLKSAEWVKKAVSLYKDARDKQSDAELLLQQADELGAYSGRKLSPAFFKEIRENISGESGRPASDNLTISKKTKKAKSLLLNLQEDEKGALLLQLEFEDKQSSLRIPPQKIVSAKRAFTLGNIFPDLQNELAKNCELIIEDQKMLQEKLLPRRFQKRIIEFFRNFLRSSAKEDETRNIIVRQSTKDFLSRPVNKSTKNRKGPDRRIDLLRFSKNELDFFRNDPSFHQGYKLIYAAELSSEEALADDIKVLQEFSSQLAAVSLPQVIYEEQLVFCQKLLQYAAEKQLSVEVNSWDTWYLTKEAGVNMRSGPGMAVLNANAARFLAAKGCQPIMISQEIDEIQLEELCQNAEVPLILCVFARPALMLTRVQMPENFKSENAESFQDARGIKLQPSKEGLLTVLRPELPYDWRGVKNQKIKVAELQLDLIGSKNPRNDLASKSKTPFLFNLDRKLR